MMMTRNIRVLMRNRQRGRSCPVMETSTPLTWMLSSRFRLRQPTIDVSPYATSWIPPRQRHGRLRAALRQNARIQGSERGGRPRRFGHDARCGPRTRAIANNGTPLRCSLSFLQQHLPFVRTALSWNGAGSWVPHPRGTRARQTELTKRPAGSTFAARVAYLASLGRHRSRMRPGPWHDNC